MLSAGTTVWALGIYWCYFQIITLQEQLLVTKCFDWRRHFHEWWCTVKQHWDFLTLRILLPHRCFNYFTVNLTGAASKHKPGDVWLCSSLRSCWCPITERLDWRAQLHADCGEPVLIYAESKRKQHKEEVGCDFPHQSKPTAGPPGVLLKMNRKCCAFAAVSLQVANNLPGWCGAWTFCVC